MQQPLVRVVEEIGDFGTSRQLAEELHPNYLAPVDPLCHHGVDSGPGEDRGIRWPFSTLAGVGSALDLEENLPEVGRGIRAA